LPKFSNFYSLVGRRNDVVRATSQEVGGSLLGGAWSVLVRGSNLLVQRVQQLCPILLGFLWTFFGFLYNSPNWPI